MTTLQSVKQTRRKERAQKKTFSFNFQNVLLNFTKLSNFLSLFKIRSWETTGDKKSYLHLNKCVIKKNNNNKR